MKLILFIVLFFSPLLSYSQNDSSDVLYIKYSKDSMGCGYVNQHGKEVVKVTPGYCFNDTIRIIGFKTLNSGIYCYNSKGLRLFQVFPYDNGPDYVVEGRFRIIEKGLIGYADELGNVIVPPKYKCAWPYENGKAEVSYNCEEKMDGEYKSWVGGDWEVIDLDGNVIKK